MRFIILSQKHYFFCKLSFQMGKSFKRLFHRKKRPTNEMVKTSSKSEINLPNNESELKKTEAETSTSPEIHDTINAYEAHISSLSNSEISEIMMAKMPTEDISFQPGFNQKQPISPMNKFFHFSNRPYDSDGDGLNVDKAGVDEEQINASMEKGLMSPKQYQQIKQLKGSTNTM